MTAIIFGTDPDACVEIEMFVLDRTSFAKRSTPESMFTASPGGVRARVLRERAHRTSLRCDGRARFEWGEQRHLIRTLLDRWALEMTPTAEPPDKCADVRLAERPRDRHVMV
ncbi:MAG TPA: hypothetical protein VM580_07365 [Labilithrix sp.]|nr:hypothetical protein [Labilithrix sp.]